MNINYIEGMMQKKRARYPSADLNLVIRGDICYSITQVIMPGVTSAIVNVICMQKIR